MGDSFGSEFFAGNRARLRTLFQGSAPIVITASARLQKGIDESFFRQDGNFWYLTGIDEPGVILVIDKDKEYLILPDQSQYERDFHGELNKELYRQRSGIKQVQDAKAGWKQLGTRLKKVKHVATLPAPPEFVDVYGFYTNPARANLIRQINEYGNAIELLDLRKHFGVMRMVKQPVELVAIKQAINITARTLKSIQKKLPRYSHEYQIEADLTHGFRSRGANGHAFDPIVASGSNAAVIHYMKNNGVIGPKDLVLLDVGAEVEGYAADISRTYAVGSASKRQQQIHRAVLDVQEYAYSLLKPGVLVREYEKKIEQFMGEKLRALGLIKNVEREEIRKYFPHATSHFLGFDVHDVGDYDRPLEPGVVLTVEPGIYIAKEGIGIRIEDDVLITADGVEVLSKKLPTDLR